MFMINLFVISIIYTIIRNLVLIKFVSFSPAFVKRLSLFTLPSRVDVLVMYFESLSLLLMQIYVNSWCFFSTRKRNTRYQHYCHVYFILRY